jgi:hypothetical protein
MPFKITNLLSNSKANLVPYISVKKVKTKGILLTLQII